MACTVKKGILFLNGEPPACRELREIAIRKKENEIAVFCTDGAYAYVVPFMQPDAVVGDFDSLDKNAVHESCEVIAYSFDKDYTDGYLAVKIMIERGFTDIDIFGAYGGRPDMAESNYTLLALALKSGVRARFCGKMSAYMTNGLFCAQAQTGATLSLVPFTDVLHILHTKGLKYALTDYTMKRFDGIESSRYIMGVSNVCECESVEISVGNGVALVFIEEKSGR